MHHPDTRVQLTESATPTQAESTAVRGWPGLVCPRCVEEATITVGLDDLGGFTCGSCGKDFSRADLEALIAAWAPVLRWLDTAPAKE